LRGAGAVPFLAALLFLVPVATADGAPAADERSGELIHGTWRGAVLGHHAAGGFLLLSDEDGFLRLEIGRDESAAPAALMSRRGHGWTVVATPDGGGTRNAWEREWQPLEPRLSALLRAGAEILVDPPAPPFRRVRVVRETGTEPDLRTRLTRRGRGRGGPGETLVIRGAAAGRFVFGSSRRPGSLELADLTRRPVVYPVREAFVPLWPLAEIIGE
jgi:hypothetical protein